MPLIWLVKIFDLVEIKFLNESGVALFGKSFILAKVILKLSRAFTHEAITQHINQGLAHAV